MKDYVLSNELGIDHSKGMSIATTERAFLDRLYINKDYYIDNIRSLNWDKVIEISKIYHNKRLENKVEKYYKKYLSEKNFGINRKEMLIESISKLEMLDDTQVVNDVISALKLMLDEEK